MTSPRHRAYDHDGYHDGYDDHLEVDPSHMSSVPSSKSQK
jgi:hypothetical protein